MKFNIKASNQIGIAIIIMAVLLFLGGLFSNNPNQNSNNNFMGHNGNNNNNNSDYNSYLFYLNNTNIGKQTKTTQTSSNIILGSKKEYNVIYLGNNFILNANPITENKYTFYVNVKNIEDVNNYMIYFKTNRLSGNQNIKIYVDDKLISNNLARDIDIPIYIQNNFNKNTTMLKITFALDKPHWYDLFNWNRVEINQLKIVEERQNKKNNVRRFDFNIDKMNLERAYIDLTISCDKIKKISEPIIIKVNDQIIANENPKCINKYNTISANIPLDIVYNSKVNKLEFETNGLYKIAYSLNKIYYNEQDVYKFTISSFNDIIDVVMYGKFDKDVIDLRINSQTISLERDEIKSIIPYLKFGTNTIKILTKPVEIDELVIEKNEFLY